ncbi:hypothetical protein [Deinococcus yavapaiensis]|uniref:Uncharacterized protein n=1 Tax=Deinococcus yavapaiensis KR-236 TaxID=694435 RepID=A0A318SFK9_9DEIO|nr:hypothetical protein [Deinococcus yavapaiensis]PYE56567.1 hypothetical protein DES52_101372 [Deinococcus yavapaiensis KR-236]
MKRVENAVLAACGSLDHPLAEALLVRAADSKAFVDFVEAHASKLRKKVRLAVSDEERADLLAELDVATFLGRDRRLVLTYEPFHAPDRRGPDFKVVFKGHSVFHVEVTRPRLRGVSHDQAVWKVARVLCDKVGQLPPGAANLLVIVVPPESNTADLVPEAVGTIERAAGNAASSARLAGVKTYGRDRARLGAVVLWSSTESGRPSSVRTWLEPRAKHPVSPDVLKVFARTE